MRTVLIAVAFTGLLAVLAGVTRQYIQTAFRVRQWEVAWGQAEDMCALASCHEPPGHPCHDTGSGEHRFVAGRLMREPLNLLYDLLTEAPAPSERWWRPIG
jgi:hypothetical protein